MNTNQDRYKFRAWETQALENPDYNEECCPCGNEDCTCVEEAMAECYE